MTSKTKIENISVECYSGYRADERPVAFTTASGSRLLVDRIMDQRRSPDNEYFKVLADDGKGYLLVHDTGIDRWILEKVFEQ